MNVHKIGKENFDSIRNGSHTVLLDFYADWCGPCRMVAPLIDEIAEERDDVLVGKVDVDREPELASRFGVYSIPTIVVLRDGNVVSRASGARPKAQILDMLNA